MKAVLIAAAIALTCGAVRADPSLPHLFNDHMVLQRNVKVRVWGWGDPGEKMLINFAGSDAQATTAADGRWEVILPAMPAGGPFVLTVQGKKIMEIKDVMIGEVWVASGQSNMTYGSNLAGRCSI